MTLLRVSVLETVAMILPKGTKSLWSELYKLYVAAIHSRCNKRIHMRYPFAKDF